MALGSMALGSMELGSMALGSMALGSMEFLVFVVWVFLALHFFGVFLFFWFCTTPCAENSFYPIQIINKSKTHLLSKFLVIQIHENSVIKKTN